MASTTSRPVIPEDRAQATNTTSLGASMLPTPPSSPSPALRKPIFIPIAPLASLPATFPSQSAGDAEVLSQSNSHPATDVSPNVTTAPRKTSTDPPAEITSILPHTLDVLKEELRIVQWRCGAQTKNRTECRREISNGKKHLIDAQLRSMIGLTRSSPDLELALSKLVMLVHCYQHNAGPPIDGRLEAWRLSFPPSGAGFSEPEVSVEQRIKSALGPISVKCMGDDHGGACENRVGGQKVQNCARTIQELVKQDVYSDDVKLTLLLKVLEWNRTCSIHQSSRQFTWATAWKQSIVTVLPTPVIDPTIANTPNEAPTPSRARAGSLIVTILPSGEEGVGQVRTLPSPRALPGPATRPTADLAWYWPKAHDKSTFNIIARPNHLTTPATSHTLIRKEVNRSLKDCDLRDGYVYAYEIEGNDGYVKIGYTTRSVTDRHDEWSFDCNRQVNQLYPSPSHGAAPAVGQISSGAAASIGLVPHARRVEALCHAELDCRRIKIYCDACLKQHIEWFEVSAVEATAVIQKWSTWIATRPYELLQLRETSKWKLKASEMQRMSSMKRFMQEIAVMSPQL